MALFNFRQPDYFLGVFVILIGGYREKNILLIEQDISGTHQTTKPNLSIKISNKFLVTKP